MNDESRFWEKVDTSAGPEECWPWIGARDATGYGLFHFGPTGDRKRTRSHRWLLGFLRGEPLTRVPVGAEDACHHCDNRWCCNPAHLYVGTRTENIGDAVRRKRLWMLKRTHCPQGHPYAGDNVEHRPTGARRCRACSRAADRKRRAARRMRPALSAAEER